MRREDISAAARFLRLSEEQFLERYCRRVLFRISLLEHPNGDCVFLTPSGCAIYPVRPLQCRTFPFWAHVLSSPTAWEAVKQRCPGVGRGRLYSRAEIEAIRDGLRST